jgi:hypothetical protein
MPQEYIDHTNLTFNSEEARTTADLVFEEVWAKPESLSVVHDVQTGIEMNKYIPILGQYGLLGKLDPGDCTSNIETEQIPTTQKQWTPKSVSFRIADCEAKIPQERKFWRKNGAFKNKWEDQSSEEIAFVTDRVVDASKETVLRIAEFNDTDHSPVGDATGNEVLTVGTDKTYFNILDGMWKQIFTDQALATPLTYRSTITENGLATKALQLVLGSTAAVDAMKACFENIDPRAFKEGMLVYQMTRSLFNNYMSYLESNSLAFTLEVIEGGKRTLEYRGIQIIERADWDRNIQTYFDNGTVYYLPHRLILTKISNIPIGTQDTESMESVDSFYDKKDKTHYMDVAFNIDMKLLLEYELAAAY